MNKNEIGVLLRMGIAIVRFTKLNGEDRIMRCTLNPKLLPKKEVEKTDSPRKENETAIRVWDLDELAWRSFRFDSVKHAVLSEEIA